MLNAGHVMSKFKDRASQNSSKIGILSRIKGRYFSIHILKAMIDCVEIQIGFGYLSFYSKYTSVF